VIAEDDPALLAAWNCLLNYDRVSTQQKKTYLAIRRGAIILTVAATAAAALTGLGKLEVRLSFTALMVILVPSLGFMLYNYDALFVNRRYRLQYAGLWLAVIAAFVTVFALVGSTIDRTQGWAMWRPLLILPFGLLLIAVLYNYLRSRP